MLFEHMGPGNLCFSLNIMKNRTDIVVLNKVSERGRIELWDISDSSAVTAPKRCQADIDGKGAHENYE